jgi:multimeric flavodoxin WrbA
MRVMVVSASPNKEGLTAACAAAAMEGVTAGGGQAEHVRLNDLNIGKCQACGNGWGTCRTEHRCQTEDDFQSLHERIAQFDALVLVTPVYWWEMSESAKAFTDRLRRCEATAAEKSSLLNKPVIAVAAAGGSGNGTVNCLMTVDNWIKHIRARMFDLVTVTRWTRPYKLVAIREAARAMVEQKPA